MIKLEGDKMKEKIEKHKYFTIAITVFSVIAASIILFFIIYRWNDIFASLWKIINILTPIIYGVIIAYVLTPIIRFLENKFFNKLGKKIFKNSKSKAAKISRIMSLSTAILMLLIIVVGFIYFVIPQLINSIDGLIKNVPTYFANIRDFIATKLNDNPDLRDLLINNTDSISEAFLKWASETAVPNMDELLISISSSIIGIIKAIANIVVGLIVSIYVLNGKETFIAQSKKILYSVLKLDQANLVVENVRHAHKIFGGFLLGQVTDALIVGIICFIFMALFNMPYAMLIAVIVGVTNVIPYFGPFIGAIPSALLILLVSPSKCITFLIFILILQQFDGNILAPKILGGKTGLKSFWVLFSILIFGGLFGFVGMLFGVPIFSLIYAFVNGICMRKLGDKNLPVNTIDFENMHEINPETKKPLYF